ncbi:ParB/RepB/Spo0J family partition protein [Streptomyces sp. NPDC058745]|uniref:ParB/RepB/Spo0J family partition protein n=1 Tax=Streptomyces sp. NPDC058745 TaxID=3346621 RepID=UPI0036A02382
MIDQTLGVPQAPPTELPVTAISINPANPRSELGDLTDLANSLKDHGQKTAISIMSREAYLAAEHDRASELEAGTQYVVIEGNSRLAAAREAGLETIKVMVDDSLGSDSDSILESALVANVHRRELDHLDEARALNRLLKIHGSQRALAKRLHRSQTWVSHRLALLNLTPELQQRLESGEESADLLKKVGSKPAEEQEQHLDRLKAQKATETAARQSARQAAATPPVEKGPDGGAAWVRPEPGQALGGGVTVTESQPARLVVVPQLNEPVPAARSAGDAVPESARSEAPAPAAPVTGPETASTCEDGAAVMERLLAELDDRQRSRLLVRYIQHTGRPESLATDLARATQPENRSKVAALLRGAAALLDKSTS